MALLTICNILSLCRAPLALLFLPQFVGWRVGVLLLSGATDYFDGFFARRFKATTQLGAVLDPIMDKFFIVSVVVTLLFEGALSPWTACLIIIRDIFLFFFCSCLAVRGNWHGFACRSPFWGKVTTICQYVVLGLVVLGVELSLAVFLIFPILTLFYMSELTAGYLQFRRMQSQKPSTSLSSKAQEASR